MPAASNLAELDAPDVLIRHHFAGGLYAKETLIPEGRKLTQHVHAFDHLSALMRGTVIVKAGDVSAKYEAPQLINIQAGTAHEVSALTDVVWVCLHATDKTDPAEIDAELTA